VGLCSDPGGGAGAGGGGVGGLPVGGAVRGDYPGGAVRPRGRGGQQRVHGRVPLRRVPPRRPVRVARLRPGTRLPLQVLASYAAEEYIHGRPTTCMFVLVTPSFFWWHGACVCVLRLRPVLVFGDKRVSLEFGDSEQGNRGGTENHEMFLARL
jgi:hypothetical protein